MLCGRAEARRLRPLRPCRLRAGRRLRRHRLRTSPPRWRISSTICSATSWAAARPRAAGASAAPTCATISRSPSKRPISGKTADAQDADLGRPARPARGSGAKPGTKPKTCTTCARPRPGARAAGLLRHRAHLPAPASGRGEMIDNPCTSCGGAGRVTRERTLSVNIPAGVEDGTRIRLAGEGEAGLRGGPPGDLYIFLSVKPHPFFQRDGADLYCRVPISMVRAALGGEIEVPTLDGGEAQGAKCPKARRPASSSGCAARACRCCARRDTATCTSRSSVETPQNLTRRQRELLAEFDAGIVAQDASGEQRLLRQDEGILRGPELTSSAAEAKQARRGGSRGRSRRAAAADA